MQAAPIPADEEERLATLRSYAVLDTATEQAFDDIVALAASICGTPVSAISLLDRDRQWFKASIGIADRETARDTSFCGHTILVDDGAFVVEDASRDPRFA